MAKLTGIYKDENTGKWYYSVSLGFDKVTGKRIRKVRRGFNTQKEAYEAKTEELKNAQDMGQLSNVNMNYKDYIDQIFLPDYEARVEITTYTTRTTIFNKMKNKFGKKKIDDISNLEIQIWKNELTKEYAQNYARMVYGLFSQTLEKAVSLGMIKNNRAKQVGNIKKQKTQVEFWTKEEFEKVLSTFNLDDYYENYSFVITWLYFMTGLWVNEATALRWNKEIDLEAKTLTVNHSLRIFKGGEWELGPTKTPAARRTIALDDDTIQILKDWEERQQKLKDIDFVLSYNGRPSIKSTILRIIKRHAKLAGVKPIQAKGLRHSHASFLINEYNVNPLIIKERLGHEDIKTTLSIYSHLYPNVNFEVANNMSGSINYKTSKIKQTKFQGNQSFTYQRT
ncbi:site-specific integrase [Bacillus cereus]|uniref:site-specific integrase n=1 Tax=Bacillus cereus TaxID=1396 RepID=UPI0024075130|nr:site-specific integrase [Bacillus cereus]MDF9505891.1 site-specific integrase [Bacillus cereus]MDF9597881.1 site-specific integrase [Bacillus cereus]MDF9610022.1 site-specific integrase [Bacillus cereus]MDF9661038.1 site-specific integrase [Bacillus cereus]